MVHDADPRKTAQQREEHDPSERNRPIPTLVAFITLAVVISGVAYILLSEPFGRADMGDRRTLADLRVPAVGTPGAAADGKTVFSSTCVACHQTTGKGLTGVFPPLDGSEWVVGDTRIVANILLYGITGDITVAGTTYKGAMPSFQRLSDTELAAVASYIRAEWSNKASAIKPDLFSAERKANPRASPFSGETEIKALNTKTP
ncbi:MAG: cytochrome c [Sideroxyarcus sp.]|nr:cytochrome c [Sideroxyarcus sp.]